VELVGWWKGRNVEGSICGKDEFEPGVNVEDCMQQNTSSVP